MTEGIRQPGTAQLSCWTIEAVIAEAKRRMLPGRNDRWGEAAIDERGRHGGEFDRFGAGADDQPDFGVQSSP